MLSEFSLDIGTLCQAAPRLTPLHIQTCSAVPHFNTHPAEDSVATGTQARVPLAMLNKSPFRSQLGTREQAT